MTKHKIIAVVGPTASGKSALGAYLAQKLRGEIISADSRQVYRGMRIISRAEPEHLVGIADPRKQFSAGQYVKAADKEITMIYHSGKIPIIIGGTGFFIDALAGRLFLPDVPPNQKLRNLLAKRSPPQLMAQLRRLDPKRAAAIDPHNKVRLIRAIEVAKALGSVPTAPPSPRYEVLWLGLAPRPTAHTKAIATGVEARLSRGMVAEAKKLRDKLTKKRYAELGFEFALLADYLDKKLTKAELSAALANGERTYALRQMRWFKRNPDIRWVTSKSEALRLAKQFLSGR